jgi:hypothetical protein
MTIRQLYQKAFVGGQWHIGLRYKNQGNYKLVDTPKGTWIADPFLYEAAGEHYLFVELYEAERNKACLGYYSIINGEPFFQGKIIDQPYHLSYPCVFEYADKHYLIPESSANETVDLYIADDFPKKWEKKKTLISGIKYVDTTVLKRNGKVYLVTYRRDKIAWVLDIFLLDMETFNLKFVTSKSYATNIARPAGNFLENDGLLRPAQDCHQKYGENLILYRAEMPDTLSYSETEWKRISAKDIPLETVADRLHTYNRDSLYECVDLFTERFELLHGMKIFWRAYLKKYFKE